MKNQQILLRCSQPLSNKQTPHPTTKMERHHHPDLHGQDNEVLPQDPTVCSAIMLPLDQREAIRCCAPSRHPLQMPDSSRLTPPQRECFSWCSLERRGSSRPLRYGYLVTTSSQSPIPPSTAPPTRVRPLASGVTDFHDVTGGVYKARERIHRSVADLRLLATPTSRGRVADPDPN